MNIARDYLVSWARSRGAVRIVSDGDLDGIFATAVLYRFLGRNGIRVGGVEFPHPSTLPGRKFANVVLVELSPSRGYRVVGENILFDHHEVTGLAKLAPAADGYKLEVVVGAASAPSVLQLVLDLLGLNASSLCGGEEHVFEKLIHAVNLVDQGRSGEDELAQMLHWAYLYNIESEAMRQELFEMITQCRLSELISWAETEAEKFRSLLERARREISAEEHDGLLVLVIDEPSYRRVLRQLMLELEEHAELVVAIDAADDCVKRLHLGTLKESIDVRSVVDVFLRLARSMGYTVYGGGRRSVGGIQFAEDSCPSTDAVKSLLNKAWRLVKAG